MHVESTEQALPGFELEIVSRSERDTIDIGANIRDKEFTGEKLRMLYPGKYALAARAFFEKNRSAECICDILQISPQTMHALIETECAARGFSSVKARIRAKSMSVALRTVTELQKLLDDPDAVKKAGIVGLTNALKAMTGNDEKGSGEKQEENPTNSSREDKDADEIIEVYEQSDDGFWRQKNSARPGCESSDEPTAPDAAMMPAEPLKTPCQSAADSVQQSASNAEMLGNMKDVAKNVDKKEAESAAETPEAHRATEADTPHGGGGDPAPPKAPGEK